MRLRWVALVASLGLPLATPARAAELEAGAIESSVVKVFSTVRYPDLYKPWTKLAPTEVTGSGVVTSDRRILTNAHLVLHASQVQIQGTQSADKFSASVEMIAPGMDLAILKLDDPAYFDSHPPLACANTLPAVRDTVMAYGYPTGGTSLSITKGIVSRIEFTPYNFYVAGLRIQIDAAINPGNSGGPVVAGDKMIGLAFSHLGSAENIGYIIPCEEIGLFLQDAADGRYDGKPAMFDELQTFENPALRSFLKLPPSAEGVVVHKPDRSDPAYPLKEWDVITSVGDTRIDNQGMIKVDGNLRVRFQYLIQQRARNGKVPLTLMRAAKEVHVDLPVAPRGPVLIRDLENDYPSYFVYGPLVFSNATLQFVGGFASMLGKPGANPMSMLSILDSPLMKRLLDRPRFEGETLVVVASPFFPHKLTNGYANPISRVVKTVDRVPIKNLLHLVEVLRDSPDAFTAIEFEGRSSETLVFPRGEMLLATEAILVDNGIRSQGSPDTLAVWSARSPR